MKAAENGHHDCISILIANGAKTNLATKVACISMGNYACALDLPFLFLLL